MTAKGTGLVETAGKEDPVELDSSLNMLNILLVVEKVGEYQHSTMKYHYL